jgi:transposase InsO family protein
MYLVCIDTHSKYMEVQVVNSATSTATIEKLCMIFATHGIPDTIVSDNGTPFTSEEFESFTKKNRIRHIRISPYQPSFNGWLNGLCKHSRRVLRK